MLLFLFSLLVFSCTGRGNGGNGDKQRQVDVKVTEIRLRNVDSGNSYVGQVEEYKYSSLSLPVAGTISRLERREGEYVNKGDVLLRLDKQSFVDAHRIAESSLEQARDGYERMKLLYDAGTLPQVQWVDINTKLTQAEAAEKIAAKNIKDAELRAPYDGILAQCKCGEGEVVLPGVPLMKIVDLDRLYVKVAVPETELSGMENRTCVVEVPAAGDAKYSSEISVRGIVADPISHTYEVKMIVDNPDHKLVPGMLAKVFVHKDIHEVVNVPANAVQVSYGGERFVWVVNKGRASRRFVTVSRLLDDGVEVSEGLKDGDMVIIEGYHKVSENMAVRIVND